MLKSKSACVCSIEWTVDGSKAEGKKLVNQQLQLMLRANGECAAVGKVRFNNAVSLENRIRRSFEQINKLGETQRIVISPEFCNLKFDELHLAHELQQKKAEEKESNSPSESKCVRSRRSRKRLTKLGNQLNARSR